MACHFARWTPASAVTDTQRLSDEVIAATRTFSVKRRTRFLQGRILLAEMMFYLYGLPTLPPSPPRRPAALFRRSSAARFQPRLRQQHRGRAAQRRGQSGTGYRSDAGARYPAKRAATRASDAGGKCPDRRAGRSAGGRNSAVEHPAKRAENFRPRQQRRATLRLHPFSGHLRSSATPDVQVMSDADEYLSWACAGSPGWTACCAGATKSAAACTKTGNLAAQPGGVLALR